MNIYKQQRDVLAIDLLEMEVKYLTALEQIKILQQELEVLKEHDLQNRKLRPIRDN